MQLLIDPSGQVRCLYSEVIDLTLLGNLSVRRASHVEPDEAGRWWADLAPVGGQKLGPFPRRSQALQAEIDWLDQFRQMETAIGGTDRLHFVSFSGELVYMNALATITASGRAKSRHDVETMNARLAEAGYAPRAEEITPDDKNRDFPEKFGLSVEIDKLPSKEPVTGPSTEKSTPKAAAKSVSGPASSAPSATAKGTSK